MNWLAVAIGGALGSVTRYGVALLLPTVAGKFPWPTFIVNLLGSFLIGVVYVVIVEKQMLSPEMRLWLMTGFLGGFTTFSSFSLETLQLWQQGQVVQALIYVISSVVLCLIAVAIAVTLTQKFFN
jgi:fluoride exporter